MTSMRVMPFIFAGLTALLFSSAASAAEIKLLSTQAVEKSFGELLPMFEKASGHKVALSFYGAGTLVIKVT